MMTWIAVGLYALACVWALLERFWRNELDFRLNAELIENKRLNSELIRLQKANESLSSEVEPMKKLTKHLHDQLTESSIVRQRLRARIEDLQKELEKK